MRRAVLTTTLFVLASCSPGSAGFTSGRIGVICERSIPVCDVRASCVLTEDNYLESAFPGGVRTLVQADEEQSMLVVRLRFEEEVAGGTELMVRAHGIGCVDHEEERYLDRDVFELAGPDGVLEVHLPLAGRGDHLVEIFSDATSKFSLAIDIDR